ncbi:hypothetical protein CAFEA_03695 [Corynebacterium afermentans subsp. afermentans]|uniref:PPE family protein n=1 Tax=Corynebacterium afermentans TaxID=38286 RepID=A0A9X8R3L2_9CORY|nr:hypothetical protein [Corynebacterium afermentans]OAA16457.1 hypothetical protein Caferm_01870 [Corynebacterium afermentans subsp. afermentans]WJY56355.1 hypothetical protein CAFEA_03695 [Corynebacterium afermentans subsp. afermentans]SIQ24744.1 hypothetical protein SAMN05421802_10947 [Corynebacterium afermentans]
MILKLDSAEVEKAIDQLRSVAKTVIRGQGGKQLASLSGFSNAGGLDEAGERLSPIGDERAPEANQAIALYLKHTADNLWLALTNTQQTDESFSGMMGSLLAPLGHSAQALTPMYSQGFQQLKAADPETQTFDNTAVSSASETSLLGAEMNLNLTNTSLAYSASDFWNSNAQLIADAMDELNGVHHALSSSADTVWIQEAMKKLTQIQNAGLEYVANSRSLANHTEALGMTADSESMYAAAAAAAYAAAEDPKIKRQIESDYLGSYSVRVPSGLQPAIPAFNRLLPEAGKLPSTPYASTDVPAPATTSYTPTELPPGLQEVLTSRGYGDLAHAKSPAEVIQQYGRPTPETFERIAAGAAPTQSASAVLAPPAPSAAGSLSTSTPASPVNTATPTISGFSGTPHTNAAASPANAGTGAAGLGLAPGNAVAGGRSAASGRSNSAGLANNARPSSGGAVTTGSGAGSGFANGRGFGAAPGAGRGAGTGAGAGFNAGAGSHSGTGQGVNGMRPGIGGAGAGGSGAGSSYAAAGANGAASNNAHGARGGAFAAGPMAAGANRGRGRDKSGSKVRTVTSAVERDGNLKALLGDAPLLLPAVIGHNVRG